jgi:hypothetical protein
VEQMLPIRMTASTSRPAATVFNAAGRAQPRLGGAYQAAERLAAEGLLSVNERPLARGAGTVRVYTVSTEGRSVWQQTLQVDAPA